MENSWEPLQALTPSSRIPQQYTPRCSLAPCGKRCSAQIPGEGGELEEVLSSRAPSAGTFQAGPMSPEAEQSRKQPRALAPYPQPLQPPLRPTGAGTESSVKPTSARWG